MNINQSQTQKTPNILRKINLILQKKVSLENKDKTAYFSVAVALYLPKEDKVFSYEGKSFGTLKFPASGDYGFGFHPIFVPDGYSQTMSELGSKIIEEHISQRVKSTKNLVQILKNNKLI